MSDLKSYKEQLETNLKELNKFEGLENDLIQKHGNLRAQFAEYREAIETSAVSEQEKREHFGYHDELIKRLHKTVLEAKALARKRTELMTRDELFKLSQERQKSLKPQSAEDKVGEEVTKSLKRMLETMRSEVERSSANISTARSTTKNLEGTSENHQKLSGTLEESRGLIRDLWRKNRSDMIYIFGALGVFIATVIWVILQRTPGFFWIPAKLIVKQVGNFIPKADKLVDRISEMTESILSDEETPSMYVDTILAEEKDNEEYGSDELLKEDKKFEHIDIKEPANEAIIQQVNESESTNESVKDFIGEHVSDKEGKTSRVPVQEIVEKSDKETSDESVQEHLSQETDSTPIDEPAKEILNNTLKENISEPIESNEKPTKDSKEEPNIEQSVRTEKPVEEQIKETIEERSTNEVKEAEIVTNIAEPLDAEEAKKDLNSQEPETAPIELEKRDTESHLNAPEQPVEFEKSIEEPVKEQFKESVIVEPIKTPTEESALESNNNDIEGPKVITKDVPVVSDEATQNVSIEENKPIESKNEFPSFSEILVENNESSNNIDEADITKTAFESTEIQRSDGGSSVLITETPIAVSEPSSQTEASGPIIISTEMPLNTIEPTEALSTESHYSTQTDSERSFTSDAEIYSAYEDHMEL